MKGTVQFETIGSRLLKGNPLGDSRVREVPVYLPPGFAASKRRRYPTVYFLPGFGGNARAALNTHPWRDNVAQRLDRLIASGRVRPCLLVIPDCFTRYGGSQYMNSEGTGRYEDHIADELVGYIDDKFPTERLPEARAIVGKSSGGYGALRLGLRRPNLFGHVACHSGDMFFEMCYGLEFPRCVNALSKYGGSFHAFWREFCASKRRDRFPHELVNLAGMASCYSPNRRSPVGFDLPFDEVTGERKASVWSRWLAEDPLVLVERHRASLRKLKTLYFDCGDRDEYFLHLGARALRRRLRELGARHVYEEYPGGHFDTIDRYDVSLRRIFPA